jgi:DNA-binding response OmpR family regulator
VDVVPACRKLEPDLLVIDMQIGSMGGMAACMAVRQEQESGRLGSIAILMLLDRGPDTFLARRSDTDGWLVKPIDAFRLRRAAAALLGGGDWFEGEASRTSPAGDVTDDGTDDGTDDAPDDQHASHDTEPAGDDGAPEAEPATADVS